MSEAPDLSSLMPPPSPPQRSSAEQPPQSPRTSTPLGPHPQSPPKQPPSPIPADSSVVSVVDNGTSESGTSARPQTAETSQFPSPSPAEGAPDHGLSQLQGLGINLDTAGAGRQPDLVARLEAQATESETDLDRPPEQDAQPDNAAAASPTAAAPQSALPDWMTDELDESWREASRSRSGPALEGQQHDSTPATTTATTATVATPTPTPLNQPTATVPALGSVRLPPSGLGSRSISTAGAFFDARESLGNGLRVSQTPAAQGNVDHRRSKMRLGGSLTDIELERGPSTPSKRVPSHAAHREGTNDDAADEEPRGTSRSPSSAPEDFQSARGSMITRSFVAEPRTSGERGEEEAAELSASDEGRGTFIHRADVSSLPPILRPAWKKKQDRDGDPHSPKKKGGFSAIGGDMFTPMKLQTMFRTPTPPERVRLPVVEGADIEEKGPQAVEEDIDQTPRVAQSGLAVDALPPLQGNTGRRPSSNGGQSDLAAALQPPKMPSGLFTFRTPQASLHPGPQTPSAPRPAHAQREAGGAAVASTRPASAAAALGTASPLPSAGGNMISAPSTPHTPMRLFKFNYEDAATRARLETLVNRNGTTAGGTLGAGETERERKRLRLDVKPSQVISGDLIRMHADVLEADVLVGSAKAIDDERPSQAQASKRSSVRSLGADARVLPIAAKKPSSHQPDAAYSPSKSALLPPIVDYVKEAPVYMSALQEQMVRSVSDTTTSSKTWVTDDENGDGEDGGPTLLRQHDDALNEDVSFQHGPIRISPAKEAKSPSRRWRQRRSAIRSVHDADGTEEMTPVSQPPSRSPLRLSARRLPPNSSLTYETLDNDDASIPPMSSTLMSRKKTWVSASTAGKALRKDESPRKLLRRYSAAAQADEELISEGEERLFAQYGERALHGGGSLDPESSRKWSDESFQRRDQKIKELEEKLARRAAEKRRNNSSWSQSGEQSRGGGPAAAAAAPADEDQGHIPFSRPQYITLHEPTKEDAHDVENGLDEWTHHIDYDDHSNTWEDEPAEAAAVAGATRRVQDGIVLYDSEKVYSPIDRAGQPMRSLRNVASEAQLRAPGSCSGEQRGYQVWQEAVSRHLEPSSAQGQGEAEVAGPRHPSTANIRAKRAALASSSSQRYLSSGYGDDEGHRGERTVSSNTLVDDRNRESYNSRISAANNSGRNTFVFGADPSAIVNSFPGGATVTRKGSMLHISQIPDDEIEQLGGENLRYDRENNRWVKIPKKPFSENLRLQASTSAPQDASMHDHADATKGRGSAFGRRSTTRTPMESTIPEASIETSQAESAHHLKPLQTVESASQRRSSRHNGAAVATAGEAATETSDGQDGRLSDSSDPFKDFESFGQSTTAADQSIAEARLRKETEASAVAKASNSASRSTEITGDGERVPQPRSQGQSARAKAVMSTATSQLSFPTQSIPVANSQPRVVSEPSAFLPTQRPINTMPRARSALRNVINYSPDATMRSSGSGASATGTAEVRLPDNAPTREQTGARAMQSQRPPESEAYRERDRSGRDGRSPLSPLPQLRRDDRFAEANGRHAHPSTPERRHTAPTISYLTPPVAGRSSLNTPPRSILKPSPSSHGVAGQVSAGSANLYRQSPHPASATRTISFADALTLHRYTGQRGDPHRGDGQRQHQGQPEPEARGEASDLSQSLDEDWSEEDETADHEAHHPGHRQGRGAADDDTNRADAISMALKQLAELTLEPEAYPGQTATAKFDPGTPLTTRRAASRTGARSAVAGRSPWSFAALRRPRRVRDSYRDGDDDEGEEDDTYDELHGYPDMTLLTDASFNVAHDKILEVITDVEPWEPGWEQLKKIDLSERRVESCLRLKEFLPSLEEVKLDRNEVAYLTGLPPSLRSLSVRRNRITQLASFGQLLNLERLDVSHNQLETLSHLECLQHLHTLIADGTQISSLDGIDRLRGLVHVSLSGNLLKGVNLERTAWRDLETLNLSHNALITVRGLGTLRRLKSLNLNHNRLSWVDLEPSMPKLRAMRISGNTALRTLDVLPAPRLRTLYADHCALELIENLEGLTRLDNLSMRQQVDARVVWPARHLRDTRRLFFSGNAFPQGLDFEALPPPPPSGSPPKADLRRQPAPAPMIRFLNLVYLELAACQLTALPVGLPELAPNLRHLNLDHNLISTLPPLVGMQRLKRLSVVGCRIKKSKSIIRAIRGLSELQVIDTRTNPCTLGLYPPLMIPAGAIDPNRQGVTSASNNFTNLAIAAAHLPPVPNPTVVQPDRAKKERKRLERERKAEQRRADKSHFNRRQPPHSDPALYDDDVEDEEDEDRFSVATSAAGGRGETYERGRATTNPSVSVLFLAADQRFYGTLPTAFQEKRALHRGLMAMVCPRLSWIDGLFVEEDEVLLANEIVHAQEEGR